MKTLFTILAFALVFGAFAQEVKTVKIEDQKPECILWPLEIKPIPVVFNVDEYYRSQVLQPYAVTYRLPCGNNEFNLDDYILSQGAQPLNEDLPFVHTLTGVVFTFDYIRPTVR